jgi:hypothetical protein
LETVTTWTKKEKHWVVGCPLLTAALCACSREHFLEKFKKALELLQQVPLCLSTCLLLVFSLSPSPLFSSFSQFYVHSLTTSRVGSMLCIQRVLHVSLSSSSSFCVHCFLSSFLTPLVLILIRFLLCACSDLFVEDDRPKGVDPGHS